MFCHYEAPPYNNASRLDAGKLSEFPELTHFLTRAQLTSGSPRPTLGLSLLKQYRSNEKIRHLHTALVHADLERGMTAALPVSCGTLVLNSLGQLLLCHVTNTAKWDIPKGMLDEGENTLQAAIRELREEAGIGFDPARFENLGRFAYRRDKQLHLYRVRADDELGDLSALACSSFFAHPVTGHDTPETDGFRWAGRTELGALCWPRMGQLLASLAW